MLTFGSITKPHPPKKLSQRLLKMRRKFILSLSLTGLLVVGILFSTLAVLQNTEIRRRAATLKTGPVLLAVIDDPNLQPGNPYPLQLIINTQEHQIAGFQLLLHFTGDVPSDLEIASESIPGLSLAAQTVTPTSQGANVTLAFLPEYDPNYTMPGNTTLGGFKPFSTNTQNLKFATVTFTKPSSGSLTYTFDYNDTMALDPDTSEDLVGFGSATTISFGTNSSPQACTEDAQVCPDGSTVVRDPNNNCQFAPCPQASPTPNLQTCPEDARICPDGTTLVRDPSNDCQFPACPSTPPTPTPQPTTPVTSYTIQVKIAGINSDIGPIPAQFSYYPTAQSPITSNINLTHLTNDIYQTTFTAPTQNPIFTQTTTTNISIKAHKHLERFFPGVTISQDTTLDLTHKPLEPGDLPPQDGVVNSQDTTQFLTAFAAHPQTTSHLSADVNYDGVVNTIDIALILQTLSHKPDELPN